METVVRRNKGKELIDKFDAKTARVQNRVLASDGLAKPVVANKDRESGPIGSTIGADKPIVPKKSISDLKAMFENMGRNEGTYGKVRDKEMVNTSQVKHKRGEGEGDIVNEHKLNPGVKIIERVNDGDTELIKVSEPVWNRRYNKTGIPSHQMTVSTNKYKSQFDIDNMAINSIQLFHVFDDKNGFNILFVTNDDMVYGMGSNNEGLLGIWFEDKKYYIEMELCSHNLRTVLSLKGPAFGRRSAEEAMNSTEFFISCQIFADLLKCVQHLHDLSPAVIHRNLKPENVLIGGKAGNLCLKLCDFGLSHVFKSLSDNRKPEYLSPEETNGETVDYKTDVYSADKIAQNIFDMQLTPKFLQLYSSDKMLFKSVTKLQKVLISMQSLKPNDRPDCRQSPDVRRVCGHRRGGRRTSSGCVATTGAGMVRMSHTGPVDMVPERH
ncbi:unnamed protein product [Medioppia subpectinata]|uniref:non-specific serine/threonine protein kinase n=1 Tax=Medioppia subpectinata TaxID=1979941 RepID=A0A7R9Q0W8_9ACAR|nr:unnamed protein product [Medioppia subpectinata]CAG2107726.1 unnamed protein product [Medioppia subpectinata]